jgi:hypothetical protein
VVALKKLAPGHCGLITAIQAGGRDTAGPPYHAFPCARGGWGLCYAICIACLTAVLMNSLALMLYVCFFSSFFSHLLFLLACSRVERSMFLVFQAPQVSIWLWEGARKRVLDTPGYHLNFPYGPVSWFLVLVTMGEWINLKSE